MNKGYHTQLDVPRGGIHNPHDYYVPIVMARLTLGMRYPEYYDDDVASAVCSAGSRCCMLCTVHHIATLKCTFGSALGRSTSNGTDGRLIIHGHLLSCNVTTELQAIPEPVVDKEDHPEPRESG